VTFSMKDQHKIKECEDCGEMYCVSCSDADETDKYCSQKCQDEAYSDVDHTPTLVPYGDRSVAL
jgi:hypothetical protein